MPEHFSKGQALTCIHSGQPRGLPWLEVYPECPVGDKSYSGNKNTQEKYRVQQLWTLHSRQTFSDFHAWFLVYSASTRLGSSLDSRINGSLSGLVLHKKQTILIEHLHTRVVSKHQPCQVYICLTWSLWRNLWDFSSSTATELLIYKRKRERENRDKESF